MNGQKFALKSTLSGIIRYCANLIFDKPCEEVETNVNVPFHYVAGL